MLEKTNNQTTMDGQNNKDEIFGFKNLDKNIQSTDNNEDVNSSVYKTLDGISYTKKEWDLYEEQQYKEYLKNRK